MIWKTSIKNSNHQQLMIGIHALVIQLRTRDQDGTDTAIEDSIVKYHCRNLDTLIGISNLADI